MKRLVLTIPVYFILFTLEIQAYHVAIFDYDNRLNNEQTTAKYLEKELKVHDPHVRVSQFTGKGDVAHSVKILKELDDSSYDLIIIITSDALIIANHVISKTPTLYTNVNNPLSLGFRTLDPPGGNISGATYYVPIIKQLEFYKKIHRDMKKIGFIFDSNNKSKKVELPESREACEVLGLDYYIEVVSDLNELPSRAVNLIQKGVDALVIGSSGMLYNNISYFKKECDLARIPVFSFNRNGVKHGALAALSSDYNLMADKFVIPMALRILHDGVSPGSMPAAFLDENIMFLNLQQAEKLNISIPQEIINKSKTLK